MKNNETYELPPRPEFTPKESTGLEKHIKDTLDQVLEASYSETKDGKPLFFQDHVDDPNAPRASTGIENYCHIGEPITFNNAFQALDWCYRNPMKEIEFMNCWDKTKESYKETIRYNEHAERFEGLITTSNKEPLWYHHEKIDDAWYTIFHEFDWKNIRIKEEDNV
jgi:hypothetical protein